jgi:hypothetical protein
MELFLCLYLVPILVFILGFPILWVHMESDESEEHTTFKKFLCTFTRRDVLVTILLTLVPFVNLCCAAITVMLLFTEVLLIKLKKKYQGKWKAWWSKPICNKKSDVI